MNAVKQKPQAVAPARTSDDSRRDLDALDAERAAAEVRLAELQDTYDRVLLSGDDNAAEAHEAETARLRRDIRRLELRRPVVEQDLADAVAREDAARRAKVQAEATAIRDALFDRIERDYEQPRHQIQEFLRAWDKVEEFCTKAGVSTPHDMIRYKRRWKEKAAGEEEYLAGYRMPNGSISNSPFPPGIYKTVDPEDPNVRIEASTGHVVHPWPPVMQVRMGDPIIHAEQRLEPLRDAVKVPDIGFSDLVEAAVTER